MPDDFRQRLEQFLVSQGQPIEISQLTPDASTREYFRVRWHNDSAIACVYPECFSLGEQTYLDVTNLFLAAGLPVAEIYAVNGSLGVIILEDFGDTILRDILPRSAPSKRENLIDEAITLIAKIQAATRLAFELNSIASRLKFDRKKLLWELNFFKTHYFETLRKEKLSGTEARLLIEEFIEISRELERRAVVLCHRDFHAANLMIDKENRLRIIDHQDARIGSIAYDLVSLLLDRIHEPPANDWLKEKKLFFLCERESLSLEEVKKAEFNYEFDLMTVQRCLKAIGTFSFQSVNRGKTHYIKYIEPMFRVILQAADRMERFPNLQKIINAQIQKL